jgi:hypothetical protein
MRALAMYSWLVFLTVATSLSNVLSAEQLDGQLTLDQIRTKALSIKKEVESMRGNAVCANRSECRAIGYGAKPCGGPSGYLVYSTRDTNAALLESKVREFNAVVRELNVRRQLLSDCLFVSQPPVTCAQNKCVAN